MKISLILTAISVITIKTVGAPFQNLGFDDANTNNVVDINGVDHYGPANELMPGWGFGPGFIGYNLTLPGTGWVSIEGENSDFPWEGRFSLLLSGLVTLNGSQLVYTPWTLAQVGDIPIDARSIRFVNWGDPIQLLINGTEISLSYSYRPPNGNPWTREVDVAGDISPFAGQTAELRFVTMGVSSPWNGLDSIAFSTIPIPEPSAVLILSFGSLAFVSRQRCQRPRR